MLASLPRLALRWLVAFALLGGAACGADTPVPDYPFPESPPLEETDLALYVEGDDPLAEEPVEEEWDDGLDGVDLSMDGEGDAEGEAAAGEGEAEGEATEGEAAEGEGESAEGESE
ncbi:MAG TPA: hypothetical protein RMH85_09360 [Polyangiaceae bacterium LLY-WYZ-15_(1-7)]|nr:hypothetical protein [Myxococcales bacterium]MAT28609.1 hypothetical protein [Sandaracinus sp.]HJK93988.1 hypothetical protein [Polyangiaceae bacterium LLY-WYZ-15_(1-7)]MBJ71962.1 hypothetical protein [Sandaracinus sp.]HJL01654.1 hypothetical protein [Polyangiaceae bacterium LLY-WYZ-15_(1-7)]